MFIQWIKSKDIGFNFKYNNNGFIKIIKIALIRFMDDMTLIANNKEELQELIYVFLLKNQFMHVIIQITLKILQL